MLCPEVFQNTTRRRENLISHLLMTLILCRILGPTAADNWINIVFFVDTKSWLYRKFCMGGTNPDDPNNPRDNKEHCIMSYFRDNVAPMINWWPVKLTVVAMFICYIAGACYGISVIEEGLERRKLSRSDSYSVEFYDREDFYFREFPYRIQVTIPIAIKLEDSC